jgi:hypothetical protein
MEKFMEIVTSALQGAASNTDLTPQELAQRAIAIALEVGSQMVDLENEIN